MKYTFMFLTGMLASALALAQPAPEPQLMKADLIGHSMGGREKCWKFQSLDDIKVLVVKSQTADAQKRVYTIALKLQAPKGGQTYAAEARVEYVKVDQQWRIKQIGLLSLKPAE